MSSTNDLYTTAAKLMAPGKGILAADESVSTANEKRLAPIGVEGTAENRRRLRQMLLTTPDIEQYLSGVILFEETLEQETDKGILFPEVLIAKGIIPGIKVDRGTVPLEHFDDETVTQGLDDLSERMQRYYTAGARFAKWRAVFSISDATPSDEAIRANAVMCARYAAIAQAAGVVPVVEPEVLYDGGHDIVQAEAITTRVLQIVMHTLREYRVDLKATILKTSMVLAGAEYEQRSTPQEVADATLRTFHLSVPHDLAGIAFLSGGQEAVQATENLNAVGKTEGQPWPITFSYSRALQLPALEKWKGEDANVEAAQAELLKRCKQNAQAQRGEYAGGEGSAQ